MRITGPRASTHTPLPLLSFIRAAAVEYFVRLNTPVTPPWTYHSYKHAYDDYAVCDAPTRSQCPCPNHDGILILYM